MGCSSVYGRFYLYSSTRQERPGRAQLKIIQTLLDHDTTDPCVYNDLGRTPYMAAPTVALQEILRPPSSTSWATIEKLLLGTQVQGRIQVR